MIYLLLDILIYNYTIYNTYFFLMSIIHRSYLTVLFIGFILDFVILHTYFFNILYLTIAYLITKFILKRRNIIIYYLYMLTVVLGYFFLSNILFNTLSFHNLGQIIILNSIFILISYKNNNQDIKLIG